MPKVGEKAPEFCLQDQSEGWGCLKDHDGKWVVLYFYPKDNTPGCTSEAIDFSKLKIQFNARNAVIMGVSPDPVLSHQRFAEKQKITIQLLSDEKHTVIREYEVWKLKKMMGREYMGLVRTTFLIDPNGIIAYIWESVDVAGHAEAVLEKLVELQP
jgi:peroxiredoxin Q/BCP